MFNFALCLINCDMESYNEFHPVITGYIKEQLIILLITSDDFGFRDKFHKVEHFDNAG